jgi:glycosyltransferase involved in cell wall biosynthesis
MEDRARISVGEPLSLSLVIPLFNKRENIRKVVIPIIRMPDTFVDSYELILVDNGSRDGTRREIESLRAEFPKVVLVPIGENQGYGGGILSGLDVAQGEISGLSRPSTDRSPP